MDSFLCPLPWMSLSLGPNSTPRVCCHQTGKLESLDHKSFSELKVLSHNKRIKEKMRNREVPDECGECFSLEKEGCISPRQQYLGRFKVNESDQQKIRYLDITIDNRCNLECIMCSPHFSKRLDDFFVQRLSQKSTEKWELNFSNDDMSALLPDLEMLTLTGGEPLLSHKAMSFLRFVAASPEASHINLRLFSNMTFIPEDLESIFNSFHSVELLLSIDSVSENYEFIRYPAKWDLVDQNIKRIIKMKIPQMTVNFHSVIMACNWLYILDLISYFQKLKLTSHLIIPSFMEIENPVYLHPTVLPEADFNRGLSSIENWIEKNSNNGHEIESFKNLISKIKKKNFRNNYIEYKAYLNQISSYRGQL
jgi:sulfatase maturation enzyme AslB (radical SAM superfamily)